MIATILDEDKQEVKLPVKVRNEVEAAIKQRARAKAMGAEAKDVTSTTGGILLPLLAAYGVKTYSLGGVGTVSTKTNSGRSINEGKLREALALEGIGAAKINRIVKKASTTWSTDYVDFVVAKS